MYESANGRKREWLDVYRKSLNLRITNCAIWYLKWDEARVQAKINSEEEKKINQTSCCIANRTEENIYVHTFTVENQ